MDSKEKGRQEESSPVPTELIQVDPSELRFPFLQNAVLIGMPRCTSATIPELICSGCYSVVLYSRGAASVRCSRCNMVNSTRTASPFPHLRCGQCRTVLMYPAGAIIVGCPMCQHLNPVRGQGSSAPPTESTLDRMSLQHLKDITNNFCNERILGRGGIGVVYKGVLGNGKMVAVKKLLQSMSSSQEQFENEVNLLMKLKHPNIVRLVGYCYETQHLHSHHERKFVFAWNTEYLLCLEFLLKGSLDKYISDASSGHDWPTQLKIIEGISYGLQYLHEQSDGPIIHLDLKPANILLEENMIPKITDFGLSRLLDQKQTIHTAINSGTLGYMPPEFLRGIITPMSDIFALGVIIMEVITGHREYPYDIRTSSMQFIELELRKWRNVLQKEPG